MTFALRAVVVAAKPVTLDIWFSISVIFCDATGVFDQPTRELRQSFFQ